MSDSGAGASPNAGGGFDLGRLLPQRSFGLKLILVCALALSMAVPAGFVYMIFTSRAMAAQTAIMDVTSLQAGSQNLMGPVIVVPFDQETVVSLGNVNQIRRKSGHMILYAETGQANAELATEIRKRGLQQVPVYNVMTNFSATFNTDRIAAEAPSGAALRWSDARIVMNVSDLRGAKDAQISVAGRPLEVSPVELDRTDLDDQPNQTLRVLGAPLGWTGQPASATLPVQATLNVSGAHNISLATFARDTTIALAGNWGAPSFD
ncbi:MAG: hypothetical protein RIR41_752, partial [Pseudomonadota bacterium]